MVPAHENGLSGPRSGGWRRPLSQPEAEPVSGERQGMREALPDVATLSWKGDNSWKPFLTFVLPVLPLLVHPDGRRQKPNILTRRSQGSDWLCLREVKRTSFPRCLCRKERLSAFYVIP